MNDSQVGIQLLVRAAKLLLEFNESTEAIQRAILSTANVIFDRPCDLSISYREVTVVLAGEIPAVARVQQLRYNAVVQTQVHEVLENVRQGKLDSAKALEQLETIEARSPKYPPWLTAVALGGAATSFGVLLGADNGAAFIAGLSTGLGFLARQALVGRRVSMLSHPFLAAFIGAVIGGLSIRFGWTATPELVLIVPGLMLVPGPHLINALLDLVDNHIPMSLARLGLAMGILFASAAGIIFGAQLTLPDLVAVDRTTTGAHLNFISDVALAAIATIGFAIFYNADWRKLWMPALGGMAGHGLRFLALQWGLGLESATFLGGFTCGAFAAVMATLNRMPVAVVAFAGAVTMIPGLHIYRAFGGAAQLARLSDSAEPAMVGATLGNAAEACLVCGALAVGLLLGTKVALAIVGRRQARVNEANN